MKEPTINLFRGSALVALTRVLMIGINSASTGEKGDTATPKQVFVVNTGDGTLQRVEVSEDGKMKSLGKATVGKAPKRVAFLPASK